MSLFCWHDWQPEPPPIKGEWTQIWKCSKCGKKFVDWENVHMNVMIAKHRREEAIGRLIAMHREG